MWYNSREMPKFRIVFQNGEKRELMVEAQMIKGTYTPNTDSYVFLNGAQIVAIVPKSKALFIELINDPSA